MKSHVTKTRLLAYVLLFLLPVLGVSVYASLNDSFGISKSIGPEVTIAEPITQSNTSGVPEGLSIEEAAFLDRIYAFEEAYYTLNFDVKVAAYEELTTQEYRDTHLDPALSEAHEDGVDLTVTVIENPNAISVEYDDSDNSLAYVWTQVTIQTSRGDTIVQAPFMVRFPHETIWVSRDGQWYVIAENL